jgi:hypothetical protein
MVAAATARQAAAAALARALATALRELHADAGDGDACGGVRLLLAELAAALRVEPRRQAQQGAAEGAGLPRTRRRREQRRAARVRLASSGAAHGGGVVAGCKHDNQDKRPSLEDKVPQPQRLAAGGRLAAGDAVFVAKDPSADCDAGARAGVVPGEPESAGARRQRQQWQGQRHGQGPGQAAAPAMAQMEMAQMEMAAYDEQPTSAEPRVAAAAAPHKRRAVAAGTAVGVAVGEGGKLPAGGEGTWTTVISRRARRQEQRAVRRNGRGAQRRLAPYARGAA